MSYAKQTLKLRPTKGIASDTPAYELAPDFWSTGQNVQFRNGFAARVGGARGVYGTLPVDVLHMLNARIDTTNYWLFFGEDEVHALETSNSDDVTGSALTPVTAPWQYTSTLLNGVPVFTNGFDAPRYWPGDVLTPFADLPDWPAGTICKGIVAFKGFLIAFDIDGPDGHFENAIVWSDEADPGTVPSEWTPTASNLAGSAYLSDTPGPCLCAAPLRGSLIVYKRSGTYALDLVDDISQVFTVRTLFTSSGALTRHAVADLNGQHFVVTDGDVILTDGTNRASVAQGRMKDYLFGQLDQDNYENLFVVYHRAKNEVWVCFPESGQTYCSKALVYDVAADAFGVRDLIDVTCAAVGIVNDAATDESFDSDSDTFDSDDSLYNAVNFSLATESLVTGFTTTAELQDTQDSVTRDASVGRYDLTMDDPQRRKFVRAVTVRAQPGFGTLFVRVGARMSPSAAITWSGEVTLTEPEQVAVFSNAPSGRYISIEIRSAGTEEWTLPGADIQCELRGYF